MISCEQACKKLSILDKGKFYAAVSTDTVDGENEGERVTITRKTVFIVLDNGTGDPQYKILTHFKSKDYYVMDTNRPAIEAVGLVDISYPDLVEIIQEREIFKVCEMDYSYEI